MKTSMKTLMFAAPLFASLAGATAASAASNPASGAVIALASSMGSHKIVAACSGDAFVTFDGRTRAMLSTVPVRCGRAGAALVRGQGIAISGEDASGPSMSIVRLDGAVVSRTAIDAAPVGRATPSPDAHTVAVISGSGALVLVPQGTAAAPVVVPGVGPAATDAREAWRGREGTWCRTKQGDVFVLSGREGPRAFDAAGQAQSLYGAAVDVASARPTCIDLDGDGKDELLWPASGRITAVGTDGAVRWSVALPAGAPAEAPIVAVGTDRGARIIAAGNTGWITVVDANGVTTAGFPRRVSGAVRAEPLVADVDGDARVDVIIVSAAGKLAAFALDDGHTTLDPVALASTSWVAATPVIADIDGDGATEIVTVDASAKLTARRFAPTALSASMATPWPGAGGSLDGATRPPAVTAEATADTTPPIHPSDGDPAIGGPAAPAPVAENRGSATSGGCSLAAERSDGSTAAFAIALATLATLVRRRRRA
jgi:hypothetical protein